VLGSRLKGNREPGSLSLAQIVAGHIAGLVYSGRFAGMSPFRAIRRDALNRLGMRKASAGTSSCRCARQRRGLRIVEVLVGQRRRAGGVSKVSGDLVVSIKVAWVLARTFVRLTRTLRREVQASLR